MTHEDVEQYLEGLVVEQFSAKKTPTDQDDCTKTSAEQQQAGHNIHKIVGILDVAATEILCTKASFRLREATPDVPSTDLKIVTHIPNFRIGLIVKIVQFMKADLDALRGHIAKHGQASNGDQLNAKKMPVFLGHTKIWEQPEDEAPATLTSQASIAYFLKYIYELQQMLFETRSTKAGILEILKTPDSDPSLMLLCVELQLMDRHSPQANQSLLDLILQIILDYIGFLYKHPDAFEQEASQQKEFSRWKQDILQHVCLILQQVSVALNILIRKKPSAEQQAHYTAAYRFSKDTL